MRNAKKAPLLLLVLLAVSLCWTLLCALMGDQIPVLRTICRLSPYILAFALFHICLSSRRQLTEKVLFVALCCYSLVECGLGVAQLAGWAESRHAIFKLTGNFVNPAPYACLLGITAVCCTVRLLRRDCGTAIKILSWITLLWTMTMVVIARSRAVWLGIALALILVVFKETNIWSRIRHKCLLVCCAVAIFLAGCFGAWMMKPESARARLCIWQIDCLAIADHPLFGVGPGAEMGAYAEAQIDYFRHRVRGIERQQTADSPQTPFNEFLRAGMGCGIPGLLLTVAIYLLALTEEIRNRRMFSYPLVVLGTFALFSFPLKQFALSLVLSLCLADATASEELKNRHPRKMKVVAAVVIAASIPFCIMEFRSKYEFLECVDAAKEHTLSTEEIAEYNKQLNNEPDFLLLYFNALNNEGKYSEALSVIRRLERISANPIYYILHGNICQMTGNIPEAAEAYIKSYYIAPSRLTALYCLMTLYRQNGLIREASETKEFALSIPVREKHTATLEMRGKIEEFSLTVR